MRLLPFLILSSSLLAAEPNEVTRLSEALGHLIGKNIEELGLPLDLNALAKGMQDEASGKESPLNAEECAEQISTLQEKQLRDLATQNLAEAISYLKKNRQSPEIHELVEGKLQYKIERAGTGESVEPYNAPIVRLKAHYINGKPLTERSDEMPIVLEESIPGFRLGLIGMKEGEIRTLYVHPELAYGKEGQMQPNALLIFEVELIRADGTSSRENVETQIDPLLQ